jgi:hypothetical protein
MANHLMEETLSPEAVAIGDYYIRNRAAELGAGPGPDGEPGPEAPQRGTRPQPRRDMHPGLAAALRLDPHGIPAVEHIGQILAGRLADGEELATNEAATTRSISYIDLCFSSPKSVSLAWAFAPTGAERATILQAHRDAVDASLRYVAREIGQVRRGKAGQGGFGAGHIAWIGFCGRFWVLHQRHRADEWRCPCRGAGTARGTPGDGRAGAGSVQRARDRSGWCRLT